MSITERPPDTVPTHQFACNNFTISDGELKPLGVGLYPPAALINHSCDPNCVTIFEGTTACTLFRSFHFLITSRTTTGLQVGDVQSEAFETFVKARR